MSQFEHSLPPMPANQGLVRAGVQKLKQHKLVNSVLGEDGAAPRAALLAFAIRIASAGIAYFSQVLLARWMGSYDYGIYVFIWVWILILGGLSAIGLNTSIIRFIPEYQTKGQLSHLRGILRSSQLIAVAISTALALAGLITLGILSAYIDSPYILPAFLIIFCLPVYTLTDMQDGVARAYGWLDLALIPPYILRPLLLLLAMGALYFSGIQMSAAHAAGCAIFATWLTAIVQFTLVHRRRKSLCPAQGDHDQQKIYDLGLWLRASLPVLLIEGFDQLLQHTDILLLSTYMSPSDVAVYFAALKTMALVVFIRFAVAAASANKFAQLNAAQKTDELAAFMRKSVQWSFWPSLIGVIILLLLGKPLLWLFGPEFTSGYGVMFILSLGFLMRAATGPADFMLNMVGRQNICAIVLFVSASANVVLNVIFIPLWGLYGAASATAISLSLASILFFFAVKRSLGVSLMTWPQREGAKQTKGDLDG